MSERGYTHVGSICVWIRSTRHSLQECHSHSARRAFDPPTDTQSAAANPKRTESDGALNSSIIFGLAKFFLLIAARPAFDGNSQGKTTVRGTILCVKCRYFVFFF